jgi:transcriptional regulator with XRE-family HTH domain
MTKVPVDKRTLRPNGRTLTERRKMLGWSREELEWQTHITVQNLAAAEYAAGKTGRFSHRLRHKEKTGQLAGISKATIASAEKGNRVFPATLEILARTLGVKMKEIVRPTGRGNGHSGTSRFNDDQSRTKVKNLLDRFERQSLSDVARFLRSLLSELERREEREEMPMDDTKDSDEC